MRAGAAIPVLVLILAAAPVRAQSTSGELLDRAKDLYEHLEVERALPLLRQLLSPGWPFEITREQRVEAYTYLGAALALAGRPDSAATYFRAALEWDPFSDLDPTRFTPEQVRLFAQARAGVFALGLRPVPGRRVDPRTERVPLILVTTHGARLEVTLEPASGDWSRSLFTGSSEGLREVAWDGLAREHTVAPPGRYLVRVSAVSALTGVRDSARVYFDVRHEAEVGEDTLPALDAAALRPERYTRGTVAGELARGLGVAAAVLVVSEGLGNETLGSDGARAPIVAGTAAAAGLVAFFTRSRRPEIPENVAHNAALRAQREAANAAIRRRNAERAARATLVVEPAAGVEP